MNNPLMFNDPSGEFWQFLAIPIVQATLLAVASYTAIVLITGSKFNILNLYSSIVMGLISAGTATVIGDVFSNAAASIGNEALKSLVHAGVQGTLSFMQGGNFFTAAASAFLASTVSFGYGKAGGNVYSIAGQVALGMLLGGVGSALTGGNFWEGVKIGGIVALFNHAMHRIGAPTAKEVTNSFKSTDKGTYVIVETDGIGHVYMKIDDEVFSYGRYNGSYSPIMGGYGPVGDGVMMKKGISYLEDRISKSPSRIYKITRVNSKNISSYYNILYNSGNLLKNGGRVINTYLLVGQNCSTTVWKSLRIGGFSNLQFINDPQNFIKAFSPKYDSTERFFRTQELLIDSKF